MLRHVWDEPIVPPYSGPKQRPNCNSRRGPKVTVYSTQFYRPEAVSWTELRQCWPPCKNAKPPPHDFSESVLFGQFLVRPCKRKRPQPPYGCSRPEFAKENMLRWTVKQAKGRLKCPRTLSLPLRSQLSSRAFDAVSPSA